MMNKNEYLSELQKGVNFSNLRTSGLLITSGKSGLSSENGMNQFEMVLKKEGDKVKAGDVVALVGTTSSNYSSSHLHFELWYEGQALDPQKYIVF